VTTGWRRSVAVAALALLAGGRLAAQDTTGVAAPPPSAPDSAPRPSAADSILLPSASDSTAVRPATDSAAAVRPAQTRAARAAGPAALPEGPVVVDRVVAVVGNRPVLASQVDEEVFSRQSQGQPLPTDPDSLSAIRKQIIASIVDEELLVQQAQRDTAIKVTDQEIADGVEQQVRKVRGNFTSEVDYKNELKKAGFGTPEEYRRWLTDQQRRAAFQNRLIDKLRQDGKLKPVPPTEQEMREYFNEQKGSLGNRPATVSFRQIVIAPRPSPEAKARTLAQADSIVLELRRGADFATAAKRFSQDPGSKDQGGSLNWFRRGVMVPEFEKVAFSLRPGVVSDPVESPFGYHIIQVERVQPGEVQARHILLIPEIDSIHIDSARALADSVRRLVLRGASFDSLQRALHDPSAEKQADNVPADKLPEAYAKAFGDADSGSVAPVFVLPGAGTREQFVVAQIIARRPPGDIRYEDVRDRIRDQLGQQLAIRRYIDRLRSATYVDIRS
jgi:peptidyl-prolyl cis-trans isomerase SurA